MTATARPPRSARAAAPARSAPARPAPVRPDLRVVPEPRPRSHRGAIGAAAVVLVFVALFANAAFHSVLVSGQGDLDRFRRGVAGEEARNERLRLRVAELESPERIVEAAERDGMVQPEQTYWLAPRGDGGATIASVSERAAAPAPGPDDVVTDEEAATASPTGADDTEGR